MNNKRHSTNEQLSLDEINNTIKFDHRLDTKLPNTLDKTNDSTFIFNK